MSSTSSLLMLASCALFNVATCALAGNETTWHDYWDDHLAHMEFLHGEGPPVGALFPVFRLKAGEDNDEFDRQLLEEHKGNMSKALATGNSSVLAHTIVAYLASVAQSTDRDTTEWLSRYVHHMLKEWRCPHFNFDFAGPVSYKLCDPSMVTAKAWGEQMQNLTSEQQADPDYTQKLFLQQTARDALKFNQGFGFTLLALLYAQFHMDGGLRIFRTDGNNVYEHASAFTFSHHNAPKWQYAEDLVHTLMWFADQEKPEQMLHNLNTIVDALNNMRMGTEPTFFRRFEKSFNTEAFSKKKTRQPIDSDANSVQTTTESAPVPTATVVWIVVSIAVFLLFIAGGFRYRNSLIPSRTAAPQPLLPNIEMGEMVFTNDTFHAEI